MSEVTTEDSKLGDNIKEVYLVTQFVFDQVIQINKQE